ncbi:MAG: ArsA family ATPase [Elainellaceae cyanobacterium]
MFSGKGGVGKTTLSCGFAQYWGQRFPDERIVLISTDPAHSLGDVLQMSVNDSPCAIANLPNVQVRALDAQTLLQNFKARYGSVLELLVERGSFVQGEDLSPVWDLSWPGLDELMGILEIQRLLREHDADRVVVDMAPSGHTLNLFGLMDFLDGFLDALDLFQEKHRVISERLTGRHLADQADECLAEIRADLAAGRQLLQDAEHTACLVVAIAEPMSLLETQRFIKSLNDLQIPSSGLLINRIIGLPGSNIPASHEQPVSSGYSDRYAEQQGLLSSFLAIAGDQPVFLVPQQSKEPVGSDLLNHLMSQITTIENCQLTPISSTYSVQFPEKVLPSLDDFIDTGRRLVLVGGKGGVGKTTVSAAIAWAMAERHPNHKVRIISIDPAHSLGDAFGKRLGHNPVAITPNLSAQEIDANQVLEQFRDDYLWELADMMSGDMSDETLQLAYGPQAWRQIVSQALPGIDEMLSLLTIIDLLEHGEPRLIILDTAPTGHLLRFLEMPTALGDWLAWIFKLWIKYQDIAGRIELMGRLRVLRQHVMNAHKKLTDATYSEFVGVVQSQSAILAEAQRLTQSLEQMNVHQRYIVHNRFEPHHADIQERFGKQTIVHLPLLPRGVQPMQQIQGAAKLLF